MLAAQGFGRPRPASVGMRQVQQTIDRLGQFQIDSVNVVTRAHYAPLFSRLGAYDPALLDRAASRSPPRVFEYWGHAACLIDVELQPALRHKMAAASQDAWGGMLRVRQEHPAVIDAVLDAIADHGPLTARQVDSLIEGPARGAKDNWGWNWSATKQALEWHFWSGAITTAGRNEAFERRYDLPGRVLPTHIAHAPTPDADEAHRILVARAAKALGVTTVDWAAEYFRLPKPAVRQGIAELADAGQLLPITIDGINKPVWLWHEAKLPRRMDARALVCPFDPLLFDRSRLREVFGTDYRIEIYVPAPQRRHGYYVYCLLLGSQIAARVDLKADRQAGVLRVQSAWAEQGCTLPVDEVLAGLVAELDEMARWLGMGSVQVAPSGDLAAALATRIS